MKLSSAPVPLRMLCLLAALASCDAESDDPTDRGDTHDDEDNSHAADAGDATNRADDDAATTSADDAGTPSASGGKNDGGSSGGDAGSARRDAGATSSDAGSRDAATSNEDAGPAGRTCGGFAALECSGKQFCNYEPPNGQGCDGQVSDAAGVCEALPDTCSEQYEPVCGCDNRTYSNSCEAHRASVSVAKKGACAVKGTSCDRRPLTCRRAEPVCPEGQVVAIVGNCFGDCVAIDQCACSEADACPQPEKYTCHRSAMHCGPYVN